MFDLYFCAIMSKLFLKTNPLFFLLPIVVCLVFTSCNKLDIFEKNISVPDYKWQNNWKPGFDFIISDTSTTYKLYIVLRHTDAYRYNNIWLNIGTRFPGDSVFKYQRFELVLSNDAKGWEGTGMDDIWEVRKLITNGPVKFSKPGNYQFTVAQIMRENPLPNIMSVGVRVERVK